MSSVSELLVRLKMDNSQFNTGVKQTQTGLRGLDESAKGMSTAMQFAGIAGVAFMGKQAVGAVADLAKLGAQADRTEIAFEDLASQAGGSASDILAAIQRATGGTVSEMDAMQAANRGILLGLGAQADQWEDLTEVARYRARAMGISVTQALNDIATGVGRESRLILDNLGIILDLDVVLGDYGDTVNKTADQLTVYERKQAIMTSVIADGQAQIQAAGGIARDTVDDFEVLGASIDNLRTSWGQLIDEPVANTATELAGAAENINTLGMVFEAVASGTLTLGEALGTLGQQKILASTEGQAAADEYVASVIRSAEEVWRLSDALEAIEAQKDKIAAAEELGATADVVRYKQELLELEETYRSMVAAITPALTAQQEFQQAVGEGRAREAARDTAELAAASQDAAGATDTLTSSWWGANAAAVSYMAALSGVRNALADVKTDIAGVSAEEAGVGFGGAADLLSSRLARLSGQIDLEGAQAIYDRYLGQLEALYRDSATVTADGTRMTELELAFRREQITAAFDAELDVINAATSQQEGALRSMASQYNELRGVVSSALQPTEVTGLDMQLAGLGEYVDKWDESARRLDAIAARGFAELEAHPDWAAALKIPEEVLAGGEKSLQEWAKRASDDVRNLFRPDLIDIGDAADQVERYMQQMAAKEVTLDLVVKELQTRGVSEEQARKQVLSMYGLEEELPVRMGLAEGAMEELLVQVGTPQIPVALIPGAEAEGGGLGEEEPLGLDLVGASLKAMEEREADLIDAGGQMVTLMGEGAEAAVSTVTVAGIFVSTLEKDLKGRASSLRSLGDSIWDYIHTGFVVALANAGIMESIADELTPFIIARLSRGDQYAGGSGAPD